MGRSKLVCLYPQVDSNIGERPAFMPIPTVFDGVHQWPTELNNYVEIHVFNHFVLSEVTGTLSVT
jgi:hypothetical protein